MFSSIKSAGITSLITFSIIYFFNSSWVIFLICWLDTIMVSILDGIPSTYSTVTCVLPSGFNGESGLLFLTLVSFCANLFARTIGRGINSSVSLVANPNIIPWSPAIVSVLSTALLISRDCSPTLVITLNLSVYPISLITFKAISS